MHQEERESPARMSLYAGLVFTRLFLCSYVFIRLDLNKWKLEALVFFIFLLDLFVFLLCI